MNATDRSDRITWFLERIGLLASEAGTSADPEQETELALALVVHACERALRAGLDARNFVRLLLATACRALGMTLLVRLPPPEPSPEAAPPAPPAADRRTLPWFEAKVRTTIDHAYRNLEPGAVQIPEVRLAAALLLMVLAIEHAERAQINRPAYLKMVLDRFRSAFGDEAILDALEEHFKRHASPPPPPAPAPPPKPPTTTNGRAPWGTN